jgi:hypothetical protein
MPEERPNRVYAEVEMALQYLRGARRRAELGREKLIAQRAEAYPIEALERAIAEMDVTIEALRRDGLRLDRAANLAA